MSALGALLFIGCSSSPELTIDLFTDLSPATEFDAVQITIDGEAVEVPASSVRSEENTRVYEAALAPGRHTARVELTLVGTSVVAQDYVIVLEHDLIIAARLLRSCRGVVCDDGVGCTVDACTDGACVHEVDEAACGSAACDPDVIGADPVTGCAPSGVCAGRASEFVCRPARGVCDVEERCDGVSETCPGDVLVMADAVCRESAGACDVEEVCLGVSADCPVDRLVEGGSVCRPSADVCDAIEVCTGSDAACPDDAFSSSETVCRPAAGGCDRAELCSGSAPDCPRNGFLAFGAICRPASSECDTAEVCGGADAVCPGSDVPFRDSVAIDAGDEMRPLLAQLTSDAQLDLISWGRDQVQVSITADARLVPTASYTFGETLRGVAVADLDGDRVLDLVVLMRDRLEGRRGRGDGTFSTTGSVVLTSPGLEVGTSAIAGIGADGRSPASTIVLLRDRTVLTTRGAGAMRLTLGPSFPVERHTALAIGDVDADGFPDIVTSGDRSFTVLFNKEGATYDPHDSPYPITGAASEIVIRPMTCSPFAELLFMDPAGAVAVAKWDGEGFDEAATLEGPPLAGIAVTDLDGDGLLDVVGLTPSRGFVYWRGAGELAFRDAESHDDTRARRWLLAFDGDGRGRDELLSGDGERLRVMTR